MATFGRLSKNQFNSGLVAQMGAGVNNFQQLHFYVDTQNRKNLTHVSASSNASGSSISNADRIFRLVICSGQVQPDIQAVTIIDMPITDEELTIVGMNRKYYDQCHRNAVEIDFQQPIVVPTGEQLNILMGLSWANGDGVVTPSDSIGWLSAQGFEGEKPSNEFPYRLR